MIKLSLTAIAPVPRPKSKAAQIADLLPEIEAALKAGHSHRVIFEDVKNTVGLDLTFGYYENTIHRVRKRLDQPEKGKEPPVPRPSKIVPKQVITPRAPDALAKGSAANKLQEVLSEPIDDFFS